MLFLNNQFNIKITINIIFYIFTFIIVISEVKSSSLCISNTNNCEKCNPLTNLCEICNNLEIYTPDENGGCKGILKCSLGRNYCNECDEKGELCKNCEIGYYPDANGACTYTENCKISYKGECLECQENFIKIGKKGELQICKYIFNEDFKNCKKINYEKGSCDLCQENYYLTTERKCIKTNLCQESIFGNCITCANGYYYNRKDNICESKFYNFIFCKQSYDNVNCEICEIKNYFDEDGVCIPVNYCSKSVNLSCTKCIEGYYLTGNLVCTNTNNCFEGDKDIGICNECRKDYYLDKNDYLCKLNIENNEFKFCKYAENGKCIECEINYYLGEDFKCSSSKNCSESKNGICISCIKDNYLDLDNLCSNIEHCIHQSNDGLNRCLECEEGYFYSPKYNKCFEYNSTYNNCKYSCLQQDKCCECKENFYLRSNDSLCFSNLEKGPFYKCIYSDMEGKHCWKCEESYFLGVDDLLCSLADYCEVTENESRCKICLEYYCLNLKDGMCYENYQITNETNKIYYACNRTNDEGNACQECLSGFEVGSKGLCVNMNNCTEKENEICKKCEKSFCANDEFGCIYSYDLHCLKCNNFMDFDWCTECEEGYIVNSFGLCEIIGNYTNKEETY